MDNESSVPPGLQLLSTLRGHENTILQVRWTPYGDGVVSAAVDNTVRFWNPRTNGEVHRLPTKERGFTGLAISSTGEHVATTYWNESRVDVWHVGAGKVALSLTGHTSPVNSVYITGDNRHLISTSDDDSVRVWNLQTSSCVQHLTGHTNFVWEAIVTPDGGFIISASADATIKVWNLTTGEDVHTLAGHAGWVTSVAVSPDGVTLASGSDDRTIRLWNLSSGKMIGVLSGHHESVTCVDFSADGRVLASKSLDGTVRLWNTETWEQVLLLDEPSYHGRGYYPKGLSFHPTEPILLTLGEQDTVIRVWRMDYRELFEPHARTQRYTCVKVGLVGDAGVGKTGLSYRLTAGRTNESYSTSYQQTWVVEALSSTREDGTVCEVVLTDYTGQPNHRMINATLLDDLDIALLLFDPASSQDPLKSIEYWLRQINCCRGEAPRLILVGSRIDYGSPSLNLSELDAFCDFHQISGGYVETSALKDSGIKELLAAIEGQIDWESHTDTVSMLLLNTVRDHVNALKTADARPRLMYSLHDFYESLAERHFSEDEVLSALKHIERHGHITLLFAAGSAPHILLTPDLLVDLIGSILREAGRNPRGLGALESEKLHNDLQFVEFNLLDAYEAELLMDVALFRLEQHRIYFEEDFENRRLLIFPQLIAQKRPIVEDVHLEDDTTFRVTGNLEDIYATLVVLLNYTSFYTRTYQWENRAQFEMGLGEVCGFRVVDLSKGEIELVLYFGKSTPSYTRLIFNGLFEKFLKSNFHNVKRYPAVICPVCGWRQNRQQVVNLMNDGRYNLFCVSCGERISITERETKYQSPPPSVPAPRGTPEPFTMPQNRTGMQNRFTETIREFFERDKRKPSSVFISHAWGNQQHETWTQRLGTYLLDAGIEVTVDNWEDQHNFGETIQPFLHKIASADFILVVRTPLYRMKFETRDSSTGSAVSEEIDLINQRLQGSEEEKKTVLPLLLDGDDRNAFPYALHGRVRIAFQQERFFFVSLFNLILTLYRVPSQDPIVGELRAFMQERNQ